MAKRRERVKNGSEISILKWMGKIAGGVLMTGG